MQTLLSLLVSFLLTTIAFASPIYPSRPIRKSLTDRGHSVGHVLESKPAASGSAAPSTGSGDKESHAASTGFAASSARMPMHTAVADKKTDVPLSTGVPMQRNNASLAKHDDMSHGTTVHLSTGSGSMPMATGTPHKRLVVNSTAGIWPSGAVLPSGASWPSGAAWPSSSAFSTAAADRKHDLKSSNTTQVGSFATGTAPASKIIPLETAPASNIHPKMMHTAASASQPAPTGKFAALHRKKPLVARPSSSAPVSDIKAPTTTKPSSAHMHIPTTTAMESHSSSTEPAPSPPAPTIIKSAKTQEAVHKSPGSPCSPKEKPQCHGESTYGSCKKVDGHWRWYWTDVADGKSCMDGKVSSSFHSSDKSHS